jgi:hypothetical protein
LQEVLQRAAERLAPQVDERGAEPLVGVPVPRPGQRTAVLVGPGVHRTGNVAGLHAFAAMTGLAIVNTYGGKGVFRWDEPAHGGTAGLQRDDWELAGLLEADVVVTSGLDPDECIGLDLSSAEVIDVPPSHLRYAAGGWPPPVDLPRRPPLYDQLAAVAGPLYDVEASPPWHARRLAAEGNLVAADAGPAGFWIARTFPTTTPGSVVVPATARRGFAVAAAIISALSGTASVAVLTETIDDTSAALLDSVPADLRPSVEVWGSHLPTMAVDWSHLASLEAVAGPITAWP